MSSFAITYIQPAEGCPPFSVDFKDFSGRGLAPAPAPAARPSRVKSIVLPVFAFLRCFFSAFVQASRVTFSLSSLSTTFKYTVLGYYGEYRIRLPESFVLTVLKVATWGLQTVWCLASTTGRLFIEKRDARTKQDRLSQYQSDQINIEHIRTKELALDVSGVPAEITVDSLSDMLNDINFADEAGLGFMSAGSRTESRRVFTPEELSTNLNTFIHHVKNRVPFLGTPPAHDVLRLLEFYKQIEDCVRLSIQKVNGDLQKFREENPENPATYEGALKQTYHELLQAKARVVLDLAIAGAHCGGRYMGEATSMYSNLCGEGGVDGTLEDELIEVLGRKRMDIAQQHIATFLGSNTHDYAAYMADLGGVLALPGTKNIVEHLNNLEDKQQYIDFFFGGIPSDRRGIDTYSVSTIIETIQAHVRKSSAFRDKITNWIRDQSTGWNSEKYDALKEQYARRVQEVLADPIDADPEQMERIRAFHEVATLVMTTCPDLEAIHAAEGDWDNFKEQIFATQQAKDWLRAQCTGLNALQIHAKKKAMMDACSPVMIGDLAAFKASLVNRPQPGADGVEDHDRNVLMNGIKANCVIDARVKRVMDLYAVRDEDGDIDPELSMSPPAEETLWRLVKGEVGIEVIRDHLEFVRSNEFLERFIRIFNEETIPEGVAVDGSVIPEINRVTGLSREVMEWLLVSNKILLSQAE